MKWSVEDFFLNISFINFYTKNVFSCLWYLPMILAFYIFFPIYYHYFKNSENKVFFTVSAIEIWLIAAIFLQNTLRENLYNFINRIPIFLFGILLGYIIKNKKITIPKSCWKLLFINLILGGYLIQLTTRQNMKLFVPVSNAFIPTFLISVSLVFLSAKLFYRVENLKVKLPYKILSRTLNFFGTMSLEFFVIQEIFVRLGLKQLFVEHLGNIFANIALIISVTLLSYLFYIIMKYIIKLLELFFYKITKSRHNT